MNAAVQFVKKKKKREKNKISPSVSQTLDREVIFLTERPDLAGVVFNVFRPF